MKIFSRFFLILFISLFLMGENKLTLAKSEPISLNGRIVNGIIQRFVQLHYSKKEFDAEMSAKMLAQYLKILDPGRYYFLESDIRQYQKKAKSLHELIRQGNIELPLEIFTRFKTRLAERLQMLEEFQKERFDFSIDGKWEIDREKIRYPNHQKEARARWRMKTKFDLLTLTLAGSSIEEAKETIFKRVRTTWKNYSQFTENDVISLYINALTSVYDPHSSYLAPQDLKNFDINIKLSLEGIGAVLRWEDGYTVVTSIVPGGAAYRDRRLQVNDRIISVAEGKKPFESVVDMRLNDVVQLIRGERGTEVRIQVLRKTKDGFDTRTIEIIRDKIVLKDGESQSVILEPQVPRNPKDTTNIYAMPKKNKIGVIRLPSFYVDFNGRNQNPLNYKSSSRDVKNQLIEFANAKVNGVILDLRKNGGGGLGEAISMSGLFIGKKSVVVVRQSLGVEEIHHSSEKSIYDGPLVVLLDRYSASAAEILAGALKDHGRSIILGDRTTFGKGTVQNIVQLPKGLGALKVTIAQFYRVSGSSTQNKGVESDIVFPSLNNVIQIGESNLTHALPWKKISAISYEPSKNIQRYLPELKSLSEQRIKNNQKFQEIEQDIENYLQNVKPRKFMTISKVQADFQKQKKQREEFQATVQGQIKDSQKSPSAFPESEQLGTDEVWDIQLQEAVHVLEDYIEIAQKDVPPQKKKQFSFSSFFE